MKKAYTIPYLLLSCCLLLMPLYAQEAKPEAKALDKTLPAGEAIKLTDKAWYEPSYGIGLKLPTNSLITYNYDDGFAALIKTKTELPIGIRVAVQTPEVARSMQTVLLGFRVDLLDRNPSAITMKEADETWKIGDSLAATLHYADDLSTKTTGLDGFHMRAAIQINPKVFVIIHASSHWRQAGVTARTIKAVMNSLDLSRIEKQAAQRSKAIANMNAFMSNLKAETALKSLVESQYFQLDRKNSKSNTWEQVGFIHLVQRDSQKDRVQGELLLPHGVRVYMSSFSKFGNRHTISRGVYYQSLEAKNRTGKWDIETRDLVVDPSSNTKPNVTSATASGIRSNYILRVNTSGHAEEKQFMLPKPQQRTYISQALAWVLPQLLPKDKSATYGYYWYDPSLGKMVYREEQVTAIFGTAIVTSKLAFGTKTVVSKYNNKGELIERVIQEEQPSRVTHRMADYPPIEARMTPSTKEKVTAFVKESQALLKKHQKPQPNR